MASDMGTEDVWRPGPYAGEREISTYFFGLNSSCSNAGACTLSRLATDDRLLRIIQETCNTWLGVEGALAGGGDGLAPVSNVMLHLPLVHSWFSVDL